jgi:hypothetical protein
LNIAVLSREVLQEKCDLAGEVFQAATVGPTKALQEAIEALYKDFNTQTQEATATYNAALVAAGYEPMRFGTEQACDCVVPEVVA